MVDDPVEGGWIRSYHGPKKGSYFQLQDVVSSLSPDRLEYFEKYRQLYFFDQLIPHQGMEETLQTLRDFSGHPKRWLDVGASVTTLFWSTAIDTKSTECIEVCDIIPEALHVSRQFKDSLEVPPCYWDALTHLDEDENGLHHSRSLPWQYHIFDCMAEWPSQMSEKSYDLITAMGLLGLSPSASQYQRAFGEIFKHLNPSGVMIGVDWIRSDDFIESERHDNTYIDKEHIEALEDKTRMQLLSLQSVDIAGDRNYSGLLVWAFQNFK